MSQRHLAVSTSVVVFTALALAACGGTIQFPRPKLSSIAPNNALAGSAGFSLTVNGSDFQSQSVVVWNGTARVTFFVSGSQLQATITPADVASAGTAMVSVFTPSPGGGPSNSLTFTINPQNNPVPKVTSISPISAIASGGGFNLTVNGSNFVSGTNGSIVTINNANRGTVFTSSTQLTAGVQASDVQTAGTLQVAVLNPAPGGGLSNSIALPVVYAAPTITTLSPATVTAGGKDFTLTVNGTGFACLTVTSGVCTTSATFVTFNGVSQSVNLASNTQATISIPASAITAAETVQVMVTNPMPGGGTSAPVPFSVLPTSTGGGLPELVDISSLGVQANNGIGNLTESGPATGGSSRFVAFASVSNNLVKNLSNGVANVFLHDSCVGVTSGCAPSTVLVSQSSSGVPANADSLEPSVSSNGRFVVFSSSATNLLSSPLSTGTPKQIYLRDTCLGTSGCTPTTTLVSVGADGTSPANADSVQPFISPDGQFVAFVSTASNLVSGATTGAQEIFLRNTCTGAPTTCTVSTSVVTLQTDNMTPADGLSFQPAVGTGGRFVAFTSTADNLVTTPSTAGGTQQVYWRDLCTGVASGCTATTKLVSISADGTASGNSPSGESAAGAPEPTSISTDGRFVGFSSLATNLVSSPVLPAGTPQQTYLRDTCTGASSCTSPSTMLVSVATDGSAGNANSEHPQVSSTGQFVVFASLASNLVTAIVNEQIFARNTCATATSCTPKTVLASVAADGKTQGTGNSSAPAISSDGKLTAFISFAENLAANDTTPTLEDVFLTITTF